MSSVQPPFSPDNTGKPPPGAGVDGGRKGDTQRQQEVTLMERMAQRDRGALVEIYGLLSKPLYATALHVLGNAEDAEEVLQDTFVRLWDAAPKYDSTKARPFAFATMILRGLCFDRLRARNTRGKAGWVAVSMDDWDVDVPHDGGQNDLYFRETAQRLWTALRTLSVEERRYVELAVFSDASHPEIAAELGEPLGTVKSRIRRAILKLRERFSSNEQP